MNKKIIIQITFNVGGFILKNEMDEEWIKYRLKIFNDYTLKSLKAQTNQDFIVLFRCRDNTIPFIKKEIEDIPNNVFIVGGDEYKIKINELIKNYNYLYLVRMDSDDMFEKHYIDILYNYNPNPETEVLISQYCYRYDITQKRLASYFYLSPPSYTLIYKTIEYERGKRYRFKGGHGKVILLEHEIISGINYMVTIHDKNHVSTFDGDEGGRKKEWNEIKDKNKIKNILNDFGI
jgi:hypothetical protein